MNDAATPSTPPAMLNPVEAARLIGIGRSTLDTHAAAELVPPPVKRGGKVLYCRAELEAWCRHGCPRRADWTPIWRAILAAEMSRRPALI